MKLLINTYPAGSVTRFDHFIVIQLILLPGIVAQVNALVFRCLYCVQRRNNALLKQIGVEIVWDNVD